MLAEDKEEEDMDQSIWPDVRLSAIYGSEENDVEKLQLIVLLLGGTGSYWRSETISER